jgi:hypothetical protein
MKRLKYNVGGNLILEDNIVTFLPDHGEWVASNPVEVALEKSILDGNVHYWLVQEDKDWIRRQLNGTHN